MLESGIIAVGCGIFGMDKSSIIIKEIIRWQISKQKFTGTLFSIEVSIRSSDGLNG